MKNILIIINPEKFSIATVQFGCYLAKLTQSRLTGVFLEKNIQQIPSLKIAYGLPYVETIVASDLPDYQQHIEACKQGIEEFKKKCDEEHVRYNVRRELEFSVAEVTAETRFADLMIISRDTHFDNDSVQIPSDFVKNILSRTECPVLVAPLTFDRIDEVLLAYDDSKSSAFAIKQFTYLIPELEDLKITMLHVQKHEDEDEVLKRKLSQWISAHYSYPVFKSIIGTPGPELSKYLDDKKRTLVMMGSYGRGTLSTLLSPSTADSLLKNLDLPFFFAHH